MDYLILLLIALSLSLDCFTISACISSIKKIQNKFYFIVPMHFGLFQMLMALVGYYFGLSFKNLIEGFDHWIAFALLAAIGIKIIIESVKESQESVSIDSEFNIILLSIATSIDALVIGLAFSFTEARILFPSFIIGITSFLISLIGLLLGKKIHDLRIRYIGVFGGIILIGIGVKTLLSHIFV
jgi:manganese efflux pump family protein